MQDLLNTIKTLLTLHMFLDVSQADNNFIVQFEGKEENDRCKISRL